MAADVDLAIRDARIVTADGIVEGDLAVVGHRSASVAKPQQRFQNRTLGKGQTSIARRCGHPCAY